MGAPSGTDAGASPPTATSATPAAPVATLAAAAAPALSKAQQAKQEVEDKRKKLLQSLTDQLKMVMGKINNPDTSEKSRESLRTLLETIKSKITALTPQAKEIVKTPSVAPDQKK